MTAHDTKFEGKVWCLGDDISTDLLSPGYYVHDPMDVRLHHVLEAVRPDFASGVQVGDIVVAGKNFGCGSSRESAPQHLKDLGVAVVIAESFARIMARNAIAIGLPVVTCPGITPWVHDGDWITVDIREGEVVLPNEMHLTAERIPLQMLEVLAQGGIVPMLREIARQRGQGA